MNNCYEWIFSGIGTSILSGIVGLIIGVISGYKIGIHKSKIEQSQKAKLNTKQYQVGSRIDSEDTRNKIIQKQEAGNDAEQIQIGEE